MIATQSSLLTHGLIISLYIMGRPLSSVFHSSFEYPFILLGGHCAVCFNLVLNISQLLPKEYLYAPPLNIRVMDKWSFCRCPLVGLHVVKSLNKYRVDHPKSSSVCHGLAFAKVTTPTSCSINEGEVNIIVEDTEDALNVRISPLRLPLSPSPAPNFLSISNFLPEAGNRRLLFALSLYQLSLLPHSLIQTIRR